MNLDIAACCFAAIAWIVALAILIAYVGLKILLFYLAFISAIIAIIKYDRWKNGT